MPKPIKPSTFSVCAFLGSQRRLVLRQRLPSLEEAGRYAAGLRAMRSGRPGVIAIVDDVTGRIVAEPAPSPSAARRPAAREALLHAAATGTAEALDATRRLVRTSPGEPALAETLAALEAVAESIARLRRAKPGHRAPHRANRRAR